MVKGLAKLRNRLCHDQTAKYVDTSLFGRRATTPPMTEAILPSIFSGVHRLVLRQNIELPFLARSGLPSCQYAALNLPLVICTQTNFSKHRIANVGDTKLPTHIYPSTQQHPYVAHNLCDIFFRKRRVFTLAPQGRGVRRMVMWIVGRQQAKDVTLNDPFGGVIFSGLEEPRKNPSLVL